MLLNEAFSFPRPLFERRVFLTMKKLSQITRKEFYRYGGPRGIQTFTKAKTGKGVGILYFIGDGLEAVRFNYEMSRFIQIRTPKITSLDYWERWAPDQPAKFTLVMPADLNADAIMHTLVDFVQRPHLSVYKIRVDEQLFSTKMPGEGVLLERTAYNDSNEQTRMDVMAEGYNKVDLHVWRSKAIEMFGRADLTQKELQQVRSANNWVIPNVIWSNFIDGSKPKRFMIPGEDSVRVVSGERETSSDGERDINTFVKKAKNINVAELFSDLADLTEMVGDGHIKALLVYGGAGTGKTHTITKTLAAMGIHEDEDYVKVAGKTSAMGLYETLFINRNGMVIFDDCDSVFGSEETRNILKAALDTNPRRVVSWNSKATVNLSGLDPEDREMEYNRIEEALLNGSEAQLPNRFEFTGRVIFISNLPAAKIEEAIRSRSASIDVTLSPEQVFDRIAMVMEDINVEGVRVSMDQKQELLDYLRQYARENPNLYVSMRNFVKGLMVIASGKPNWRALVKYV